MLDGIRGLSTIDDNSDSIYKNKVDTFLQDHPVEASNLTVKQARERLKTIIDFNARIKESLKDLGSQIQ
jgi:hypothetical protein